MIPSRFAINWIPAFATGHSHTSVGSSNNLHSFATAAASASDSAAAAAQCIKVLLHKHYNSSSDEFECKIFTHIQCNPLPQLLLLFNAKKCCCTNTTAAAAADHICNKVHTSSDTFNAFLSHNSSLCSCLKCYCSKTAATAAPMHIAHICPGQHLASCKV